MFALLFFVGGCAMPLSMETPTAMDLSHMQPYGGTAGLYLTPELRNSQYELTTSPFDVMVYPVGDQTAQLMQKNIPQLFENVIEIGSMEVGGEVDLILKPAIVKFDAVVPMPAYNPYRATMIYRLDVYSSAGEKLFSQTAVGEAQSSKGMLSGFSARTICADVAQQAMDKAAKQLFEGLAEAEELKPYK